jgi:hypothetical protein
MEDPLQVTSIPRNASSESTNILSEAINRAQRVRMKANEPFTVDRALRCDQSVEKGTVFLVGTSHEYQRPLAGSSDQGPEQFRAMVAAACQREDVKAIAEEMSVEALDLHGVHQSVCKQLADILHIAHRYCDPGTEERKALGIIDDDTIRMAGFLANRDPQQVEADVRASYAIREGRWLEHSLALDAWPVLFVCGANHTESFRALLLNDGIIVHVLFRKWVPD